MSDRADEFFTTLFPDPQERALVAGILAQPDDRQRYAVYADWLEERGDPLAFGRAEFLRLEHAGGPSAEERLEHLRPTVGWGWLSAVGDTAERFRDLQQRVAVEWGEGGWNDSLEVANDRGLLDVHFRGTNMAETYQELTTRLVQPDVAAVLRSIKLDFCGERGFANGTCEVYLDWLVEAPVEFPHLSAFEVTREYRGLVIGGDNEGGVDIARVLRKCRALERLALPSAPDSAFFEGGPYALVSLAVNAGYDHQSFLLNLSRATCFPHLRHLEFLDYRESYMDGWQRSTTPFEHYEALFRSPLMAQLKTAAFQEVALSPAQVKDLLAIRKTGVTIERHQYA